MKLFWGKRGGARKYGVTASYDTVSRAQALLWWLMLPLFSSLHGLVYLSIIWEENDRGNWNNLQNTPQLCLRWQILPVWLFLFRELCAGTVRVYNNLKLGQRSYLKRRRDGFMICITMSLMWLLKHILCLHRDCLDKSGKRPHEIISKCPYVIWGGHI